MLYPSFKTSSQYARATHLISVNRVDCRSSTRAGDDKQAFTVMASALEQFVNNVRTLSKQGKPISRYYKIAKSQNLTSTIRNDIKPFFDYNAFFFKGYLNVKLSSCLFPF